MNDSQHEYMFVKKQISEDELMLEVLENLTWENEDLFANELDWLQSIDTPIITLNLSTVQRMKSSCIGKILLFRKALSERG